MQLLLNSAVAQAHAVALVLVAMLAVGLSPFRLQFATTITKR
jgi:hypothetical protein